MVMISGLELSIPALFLLGIQTSPHCSVMCGGLQLSTANSTSSWALMQGLRILSYSLMGAAAGWLGGRLLWLLPQAESPMFWRLALGGAVVALGLIVSLRQPRKNSGCPKRQNKRPLALAAGWAFIPCPMLYAALGVATFSAHPINGGLLLLAFALGTLPAHSLQLLAYRWLTRDKPLTWHFNNKARGYLIAFSGSLMLLSGLWLPADSLLFCNP